MKPYILITNDDGILSPGLLAVVSAVNGLGDVLVAAPIVQQTGMGRAFPRTPDQGIIEKLPLAIGNEQLIGYGIHGSPAYTVAHSVLELVERKPDLCISGINYGENLGMIPTCSGTIGAALEAVSHEIPSIAISLQIELQYQRMNEYRDINWSIAEKVTRFWVRKVLDEGIPKNAELLNINIPNRQSIGTEYRLTNMSRQNYFHFIKPKKRDYSKPFELKSELRVDMETLEKDSDIYAVYVDKITSVTPMTWDMTMR